MYTEVIFRKPISKLRESWKSPVTKQAGTTSTNRKGGKKIHPLFCFTELKKQVCDLGSGERPPTLAHFAGKSLSYFSSLRRNLELRLSANVSCLNCSVLDWNALGWKVRVRLA